MSHFYGTINGQAGEATRRGSKNSGLRTVAASWRGAVSVDLYINDKGEDCFRVYHERWHGHGISQEIASGVIGKPSKRNRALVDAARNAIVLGADQ